MIYHVLVQAHDRKNVLYVINTGYGPILPVLTFSKSFEKNKYIQEFREFLAKNTSNSQYLVPIPH